MNNLALQFNLFRAAVIIMEAAGALIGVYRLIDDLIGVSTWQESDH